MTDKIPQAEKDAAYLYDIILEIERVGAFIADDEKDLKTQYAVMHSIVIMGEATARLSDALKDEFPQITWRLIKDMRNVLVHEYDDIEPIIVWDVVKNDLPELKPQLMSIINILKERF